MSSWKKLEEMRLLGKPYPRVDGADKVSGKAKYSYDVQLPGMLYGRILRSPYPHAKVKSVDASKVEALPGVKAVLTKIKDEVLFAGDEVAAVAAVSEGIVDDALELFQVEYEVLPFTVLEEKAMKPDAAKVFSERDSNLGKPQERSEGDMDKGFAEADMIIEQTYRLAVQTHSCLETHGCVAEWRGDELYLWDSTQAVHGVRSAVAKHYDMPENKVHVITHHMGGGFGSKLWARAYNFIAADLAKKAGAAVKLMLDREEDFLCTGNRPSSVQKLKIGAKRDGTLTAFQMESYGTGGISGGAGVPQPYIYFFPNYKITHHDVFINAGPAAPMRAPGHPQAAFAMDSLMDELAEKLGMDPLELRRKNDRNETRAKEYQLAAEKFGWQRRKPSGSDTGNIKRGMGIGTGRWGGGGNKETKAIVSIYPDGSVDVKIGTQDIGVGTRTIVAGVVAEVLGLDLQDVKPLIGESDYPWAPGSGGSTTAASVCPAIKNAADRAKAKLMEKAAARLQVQPDDLQIQNKGIIAKSDPDKKLSWKKACFLLGNQPISEQEAWSEGLSDSGTAGCQFAEVEVDTETGEVKVLKVTAAQDCGLVVNMLTATNQVNGAMIGAVGYALLENRILDQNTGIMVNPNLENYKVPGAMEMPEFDVTIIDESQRGVIGLGEPPAIPGPAAIANAVANAIGVHIRELPITPDKVLMALAKGKEGSR